MISPIKFQKAPDGSLFVKKGNEIVPISIEEVIKRSSLKSVVKEIGVLQAKQENLNKSLTHLKTFAKSHFICVFSLFKTKVMEGEIEIEDEELLKLDEKVISGELKVEDAIKQHKFLRDTYKALFEDTEERLSFPEV